MAQRQVMMMTDDLDGTPIEDGDGQTISFALDGASYEIDLAKSNADQLGAAFAPYIGAARRVGGRNRSTGTPTRLDPRATKAIRAWAKAQGLAVSERGRIPADIVAKFEADHLS